MAGLTGVSNYLQLNKEAVALSRQASEMAGRHPKSLVSTATVSALTDTLSSWSSVFQGGESLTSAAIEFQRSNAATASTLAAVAAQRVAAPYSGRGSRSFDGQFEAVARHIAVEDIPVSLREEHPGSSAHQAMVRTAAANMGLSNVPADSKDRWILELLVGYALMILYGWVQVGMTADPVTPELVMGSLAAGSIGVAGVRWAPGVWEKLRKPDSSDH